MSGARSAAALLLALSAWSMAPPSLSAQSPPAPTLSVVELSPIEPASGSGRGTAVALDGNWLAVGARTADPDPPGLPGLAPADGGAAKPRHTGAVYLFERVAGRWFQRRKLTLRDGKSGDQFGSALALRNGVLAVAAPGRVRGAGAVYLFAQGPESAWSQEAVLTSASCGAAATSRFGRSVALDTVDGSRLAVGLAGGGGACVFRRTAVAGQPAAWEAEPGERGTPITLPTPQPGDRFGESQALTGSTLAVGAPGRDFPEGKAAGAVFLFTRKGGAKPAWVSTGRLRQKSPEPYDQFGVALAASNGPPVQILVGADGVGQEAGAAYLFTLGTPISVEKLSAPAVLPGQRFGAAVALDASGDRLAVGAPALPTVAGTGLLNPLPAGAAYVYERTPDGWVPLPPLADPRDEPLNLFGAAVAVSGMDVVAAVPVADQGGGSAGSAYQFQCSGGSCAPKAELAPCDLLDSAFRATLAASGDLVAIGVLQVDQISPPAAPIGAVYLFRQAGRGWRQEARLLSPQTDPHDGFGSVVALDGDTLAVGAPDEEGGAGAVYVFHRAKGWMQPDRLPPPSAATGFGRSLALDSGTLAAGATGAVYTFMAQGDVWSLTAQLMNPSPDFGAAVALRGKTLVVGAPSSAGPGAAYVFQDGATQGTPLPCPPPCSGDFGRAVAVEGDTLAVGDPGRQSASLFVRTRSEWKPQQTLPFAASLPGFGATLDLRGDFLAVGAPDGDRVFLFQRTGNVWASQAALTRDPVEPGLGSAVALGKDFLAAAPGLLDSENQVLVFLHLSALFPPPGTPR